MAAIFTLGPLCAGQPVLSPLRQRNVLSGLSSTHGAAVIHAFQAREEKLYFLVTTRISNPRHIVLVTNPAGDTIQTIPVTQHLEVDWLNIADNGDIYLLKRRNASTAFLDEYLVYASSGALKGTHRLSHYSEQRVLTDTGLLALLPSGEIHLMSTGKAGKTQPSGQLAGRVDGSVASCRVGGVGLFVEKKSAVLHISDFITGKTKTVPIIAQEVVDARSTYAERDRPKAIIVNNMTCDGKVSAYLTLSGIRLPEGAAILQLDGSGVVSRGFRCKLPRFKKYAVPGNEEGYMIPALISVSGAALYLLDPKGEIVQFQL